MLPAMVFTDTGEGNWMVASSVTEKRALGFTAPPVVVKQPLGFMDLPGEVRNMIYPHLLISPSEVHCTLASSSSTPSSFGPPCVSASEQRARESADDNNNTVTTSTDEANEGPTTTSENPKTKETETQHLYPAILATNRLINAEATPLLYALNTFTATITSSAFMTTHSPPLRDRSHRHMWHTRSWTIVIDLVASTPDGWGIPEWDWQVTIDEGSKVVDAIKKRVRKVCRVLKYLKGLEKVRIEVVSDYGWQLRSRLVGVGMVKLLEEFKMVRAKEVEIEGAGVVVPKKRILNVRKAMMGIVDPPPVEVVDDFYA